MKYFLIILIFITSCSQSYKGQEKFERLLSQKQCSKAYESIPESNFKKVTNTSKRVVGSGARYLFTGVGYSVDFIITLTAKSLILMPYIFAGSTASTQDIFERARVPYEYENLPMKKKQEASDASERDIPKISSDYYALTSFGPQWESQTKSLPCPDLTHITESIIKISKCYQAKGEPQKGLEQLENIIFDPFYSKCLDRLTMTQVHQELEKMRDAI